MAKRLELTEKHKEAIRAVAGDPDMDFSKIVAYEAVAASTRPISQRSSPYNGAQMTEAYLRQMSAHLKANPVTLQVMHDDYTLPTGRVFMSDVFAAEAGHWDLNAAFYVLASETALLEKIDTSIIDEVSVGTMPKHAFCSQCDFDYMSEPYYLYARECPNEHQLGKDGVHLRLTEMSTWTELSLVNRGASSKPKILGAAKQRLGAETYQRLAASGAQPDLSFLFSAVTLAPQPPKTNPTGEVMDPQMLELAQTNGRLESEKKTLADQLTASQAALTTANTEIADLKTKLEAASTDTVKELDTLKASHATVTTFLSAQYKAACVAANLTEVPNATPEQMIAAIDEAKVVLAAIPRGGVTDPADKQQPAAVPAMLGQAAMYKSPR